MVYNITETRKLVLKNTSVTKNGGFMERHDEYLDNEQRVSTKACCTGCGCCGNCYKSPQKSSCTEESGEKKDKNS